MTVYAMRKRRPDTSVCTATLELLRTSMAWPGRFTVVGSGTSAPGGCPPRPGAGGTKPAATGGTCGESVDLSVVLVPTGYAGGLLSAAGLNTGPVLAPGKVPPDAHTLFCCAEAGTAAAPV